MLDIFNIGNQVKYRFTKLLRKYSNANDGAVAIEFVLCSVFFIPLFLGLTDIARANDVRNKVADTGESVLRAMVHVPEYDNKMRSAFELFCQLKPHAGDDYDIQIVSGTYISNSYNIYWQHYPCGNSSSDYQPITVAELDSKLGTLSLREGEGFVAVKLRHKANGLANSKFLYVPEDHTFEYFDAAIPRISNVLLFTNDDLYDINSYEY